jgi:methionine sulfoxide reductase heme-binding subunit
MTGPDPLHYGWWLASRSAGIVSILAVSVSVIIGLMMANGLPKKGWLGLNKRKLVAVHESTALAGMVAISVHGLTLLGDKFMHPTLSQIAVPFTMGYRPGFTGLGIIAGWLAIFLGLSFYARRRIGVKRWRSIHRATIAVWALGVVHALGSGTDAGQVWLQAILLVTGIPIVYLFLRRILPSEDARPAGRVPSRSPAERLAAAERRAIGQRLHPHPHQPAPAEAAPVARRTPQPPRPKVLR